jgi:hypothetical protein
MTSPLSGPSYGFVWDNLNNGQVAPGSIYVTTCSLNTSTTISAVTTAVTATRGALITGTGMGVTNFIATATSAATTLVITNAATITATETITVQNFPVLIGGEWTAAVAAGAALTSSYWNSTGAVRPSDSNQALFADIYWINGGTFSTSATISVGQVITGWFLRSFDGGNTFESAPATASQSVAAVSRAPDFIIPLDGGASYAAGVMRVMPQVALPSGYFKTIIQNNGTLGLPAKSAIFAIPITPAY